MSNITIQDVPHESFVFSGGEIQVKLDTTTDPMWMDYTLKVTARIKSAHDLMELGLVCNALNEQGKSYSITLPYLPYARQDRVCVKGEAHGVRFILEYLHMICEAEEITCYDLHSDVPLATGYLRNVSQDTILHHYRSHFIGYDTLISPDAGSLKKIYKAATALEIYNVVKADKVRDVLSGEITSTEVYAESLKGKHCLIVDDICDGGRTFIELAKVLKAKGAERVGLYVTHGIFSKPIRHLYNAGINEIYTTDTWTEDHKVNWRVEDRKSWFTTLPVVKEGLR